MVWQCLLFNWTPPSRHHLLESRLHLKHPCLQSTTGRERIIQSIDQFQRDPNGSHPRANVLFQFIEAEDKIDRPAELLVDGLNGAGKTSLAREYASAKGIVYLGADEIAEMLFPKYGARKNRGRAE